MVRDLRVLVEDPRVWLDGAGWACITSATRLKVSDKTLTADELKGLIDQAIASIESQDERFGFDPANAYEEARVLQARVVDQVFGGGRLDLADRDGAAAALGLLVCVLALLSILAARFGIGIEDAAQRLSLELEGA